MSSKFEEQLRSEKREQFLNAVIRACQEIGATLSYVNFDGCNFSRNENAHIHIEKNTICVSENYLKRATNEDLKNTAYHEVAHLINGTHDSGFTKICNTLKTTLWEPPKGVQRKHLDDFEREQLYNYIEEDLRKWKRIEIDENGEEYFLKGKTLFKRYLKDEIPSYKPRCILTKLPKRVVSNSSSIAQINTPAPSEKNDDESGKLERDLKQLDEPASTKDGTCTPIKMCDFCKKEIKSSAENRIYTGGLHDIVSKTYSMPFRCKRCGGSFCDVHRLPENHDCSKEQVPTNGPSPQRNGGSKPLNLNAVIIIFFGIILSSFILSSFLGNSSSQNHVTTSNFNNNITEKITNPIPTPKDIFSKVNQYREQNKKFKILWSDDAYRLADFRASDMVKRNYFSHTTPDGKTVSDYIGKYNFYSSSAWGENLCKDCSDPTQTWIESADNSDVLLGGWGKGAVACESDICVFIGVNE